MIKGEQTLNWESSYLDAYGIVPKILPARNQELLANKKELENVCYK